MDLLIILTYVAIAWSIFKIFKIPVNKWTVPTAALGGVFIVSALILLMNYNHPYTFLAQKAVISIPITPQVTGVVNSVTDKANQRVKKGGVLFTIDPARYQARVDRLQADLVTALHSINTLKAQLSEAQANTTRVSAERDRLYKDYQRYLKGSQARVNPFSESDIDKLPCPGRAGQGVGGGAGADPEPAGQHDQRRAVASGQPARPAGGGEI